MIRINCVLDGERTPLATFADEANAIDWLDTVLVATTGESLRSRLNEIQLECRDENGKTLFPDKNKLPLCIVNLVLKEFNLETKDEDLHS